MEYYNLRIHHFLLCTHWNILNPFPPLFLQSIPHRPAAPLSPLHTCTSPIYLTLFPHHDMLINEGDVVSAWSAPPARPPPTWLWEPPTAPLVTKNSFFCLPTPSKICSLEYICKIGHISTHCSIVPYLRLIYVPAVWIPAAFNTSMASSVVLVLYVVLRALFIVICLGILHWFPPLSSSSTLTWTPTMIQTTILLVPMPKNNFQNLGICHLLLHYLSQSAPNLPHSTNVMAKASVLPSAIWVCSLESHMMGQSAHTGDWSTQCWELLSSK